MLFLKKIVPLTITQQIANSLRLEYRMNKKNKKNKILVTGATGFVGQHVVQELVTQLDAQAQSQTIIVTARSPEKIKKFGWHESAQFIPYDLNELSNLNAKNEDLFSYFQKPDKVIHLAWEGLPNYSDPFHTRQNLPSHYNFIKNMIEGGLNDISVIGTCYEYGLHSGSIADDAPTAPCTEYAIAKDKLRDALERMNKHHSFNLKWIRLFYMYGKGQNDNSLLAQLETALLNSEESFNMSRGDQLRDYLPVEQVARYIVKIALQDSVTGTINCCSGKPISIKQLVQNYIDAREKKIKLNLGYYPYLKHEPFSFWGKRAKLNKILEENG